MADTITANEATSDFSNVLAKVEAGREFVVTQDGVPVARITPQRPGSGARVPSPEQRRAFARSLELINSFVTPDDVEPLGRIDRNEIYDNARSWQHK